MSSHCNSTYHVNSTWVAIGTAPTMCTACVAIVNSTHHVHSTCVGSGRLLSCTPASLGSLMWAAMQLWQLAMNNATASQRKLLLGKTKEATASFPQLYHIWHLFIKVKQISFCFKRELLLIEAKMKTVNVLYQESKINSEWQQISLSYMKLVLSLELLCVNQARKGKQ